ncbi:MAG: GNAT family N-acetyltransferase [Actinobacteria bacterium]|nr:GNAT family N-acetyltransferase [Actinomycetota bacterium]
MEGARAAVAGDLDALERLARQASAELHGLRGGPVWSRREAHPEPLRALLEAALSGADQADRLVVGTIDDTVVGYGWARIESLHDDSLLLVITDLYTEPEARGVGVGEAMMVVLEAEARLAGAIGLDALALPGDRQTKNFFETFGLTARAIVVHRSLEPTEDAGS